MITLTDFVELVKNDAQFSLQGETPVCPVPMHCKVEDNCECEKTLEIVRRHPYALFMIKVQFPKGVINTDRAGINSLKRTGFKIG